MLIMYNISTDKEIGVLIKMLQDYDYHYLYEVTYNVLNRFRNSSYDRNQLLDVIQELKADFQNQEIWEEDEELSNIIADLLNIMGEREFVLNICKSYGLEDDEAENFIYLSEGLKSRDDYIKCLSQLEKYAYNQYQTWCEKYEEDDLDPAYTDPYREVGMSRFDFL